MKSDSITVYRLKENWGPFDKGTEFIYDIESGARFINSREIGASKNCFNVYFSVTG